jgi:16S rRNA (guanine966-N2)-methyltransferase
LFLFFKKEMLPCVRQCVTPMGVQGMRIIAGAWRGRALAAPAGTTTRPTADRVRQALFDMLMHAPWGGREAVEGALVLDAFAGTGALGLEALSRGAAEAVLFETDPAAVASLHANVTACGAGERARVVVGDVLRLGVAPSVPRTLVFLDPPYGQGLVQRSLNVLRANRWLAPGCLVVAEQSKLDPVEKDVALLAQRVHGAALLNVWRE